MAEETSSGDPLDSIALATEVTVAWLNNPNNRVGADDVPAFLKVIHGTITDLARAPDAPSVEANAAPEYKPAVAVRSSIKPDYIISLITGQKLKSLKRHLSANGLSPKEYRERYGLKADYPMVAPSYSEERRKVAKRLGLGNRRKDAQAQSAPATTAAETTAASAPKKPAGRSAAQKARASAPKAPKASTLTKAAASPPATAPKSGRGRKKSAAPAAAPTA